MFRDRASGARADRPDLTAALSHFRRGDTLVVWRLDRHGRTTSQLVNLLEQSEREGVCLRSLRDETDPASVKGDAMLQEGAVFAEIGRNLLRERTKAAPAAARACGRLDGRKPRLSAAGLDTARRLMADPLMTMEEIASRLGVGRTTIYRALGRTPATPVGGTAASAKAFNTAPAPGRKPRVAAVIAIGRV